VIFTSLIDIRAHNAQASMILQSLFAQHTNAEKVNKVHFTLFIKIFTVVNA
jgi:hypothetical protein